MELGLRPWEIGKYTVAELRCAFQKKAEKQKSEYILQAQMLVALINACGCNLKKAVSLQDLIGFGPEKEKPKKEKTKDELEDELHFLKTKLKGGGSDVSSK